jgi:CHAT domain-containing protein
VYRANAERLAGEEHSALEHYRQVRTLIPDARLPEVCLEALTGLAALHRQRGDWDEAVDVAREAVSMVESMRSNITVHSERTHFLHIRSNAYQILAGALARRKPKELEEPFALLERVHARTLREVLAASADSRSTVTAPHLSAVRQLLEPADLLVEFLLGEEESSLLVVDARGASFHSLPPRRRIEAQVESFRSALLRPLLSIDARLQPEADFRRFAEQDHQLFRTLLGPVADRLDEVERLIIVPDRKLHLLPFEALLRESPEPGRPLEFLGTLLAVEYLPAAAFLTAPAEPGHGDVLVVAAASGRPDLDLAPLRHAGAEVRAVVAAYPHGRVERLEGEAAHASRLLEAASRPLEVLHITAHGLLDPGEGPRIVLHGGAGEESWLDVESLAGLSSAPRVVVLSACNSARGELIGGEGILGLVRAFTLAGSRQVVASLWVVDDEITARIMGRTHRELAGGARLSAALQAAREEAFQVEFVHPFYWAGLVLYGHD